jgi:pilus assembly protein CpaF
VENDVIETETVFERVGVDLVATGGMPPRLERFQRLGIDVHAILAGRLDGVW